MTTREIHTLNGTRWTSTSARWGKRAPYGQSLNGCNCGPRRGLGELPSGSIARGAAAGQPALLTVSNYLMSQGAYDPQRMLNAMAAAISSAGLLIPQPKVEVYPLIWTWRFNGPLKIWESVVASASSGPFQGEDGGSSTAQPTDQMTQALPSRGNVIAFPGIQVAADQDLNTLLGALRTAKVTAARGSNATTSGQIHLKTTAAPKKTAPVLVAATGALGFILAWNLLTQGSSVGKNA